jgi:hypothetical protein
MPEILEMPRRHGANRFLDRKPLRRFRAYGLTIASEFDLLLPEDSDAEAPAFTISIAHAGFFDSFLAQISPVSSDTFYRYESLPDGSGYLRWYDLCDFLIGVDGRTIICGPRHGVFSEAHVSYLLSFALSFALLQTGDEALHATVIESKDRAIAFLGRSGAGKSTLASYFLEKGCRLLTDDLLRVTISHQSVIAHPGPPRIKLLPESAAEFMKGATCTNTMNPFTTKQLIVPAAHQRTCKSVPLKALYLLESPEDIDDASVRAEKLHGGEAALAVVASTFNSAVKTPERLSRQLQFAVQILAKIPIIRLSYPRRFDVLDSVYEKVVVGPYQ